MCEDDATRDEQFGVRRYATNSMAYNSANADNLRERKMGNKSTSSVINCRRLAHKLFGMAPHTLGAQQRHECCDRLRIQEAPGEATALECNESIAEHLSIVDSLRYCGEQCTTVIISSTPTRAPTYASPPPSSFFHLPRRLLRSIGF